MSRVQKEKLETLPDAPLQIITKNATEKSLTTKDCIAVTIENRKKDADTPLYLKRV